jgi:hypothetical protein
MLVKEVCQAWAQSMNVGPTLIAPLAKSWSPLLPSRAVVLNRTGVLCFPNSPALVTPFICTCQLDKADLTITTQHLSVDVSRNSVASNSAALFVRSSKPSHQVAGTED